jgi:hypothetical protein
MSRVFPGSGWVGEKARLKKFKREKKCRPGSAGASWADQANRRKKRMIRINVFKFKLDARRE